MLELANETLGSSFFTSAPDFGFLWGRLPEQPGAVVGPGRSRLVQVVGSFGLIDSIGFHGRGQSFSHSFGTLGGGTLAIVGLSRGIFAPS